MTSMSKTRENEQGIVSILVTMIMILVISLTVLGFAQISRRNQREALDNQLSTQAYYAAESGVNAAVNYLTNPVNIDANINNTDCNSFISTLGGTGVSNVLDTPTSTKYTCLMVNTQPTTLNVSPLTQTSNTILHLENADGNPPGPVKPFTQLKFLWQQQTSTDFPGGPCTATGGTGSTLPSVGSWNCPYGILRLDLTDASAIDSADLNAGKDTTSFYFVPSYQSGGAFVVKKNIAWPPVAASSCTAAAAGDDCPVDVVPVTCTAAGGCPIELDLAGASGEYFARLSMMYQDSSSVTVTAGDAAHNITSGGVKFTGGQAVIDSTGQAQDELRRIQVRIPLVASGGTVPVYGLQTTQSICKQLSDGPTITTTDNCNNPPHP